MRKTTFQWSKVVSEAIFPTNRGHTFVSKSVRRFSFRASEVPDLRERKGHFYIQQLWGGRRKHSSGWFGTPLKSPMSCKKVPHSFCLIAGGVKSRAAQSDHRYKGRHHLQYFLQYYSTQYFSIVKSVSGPMASTLTSNWRLQMSNYQWPTKGEGDLRGPNRTWDIQVKDRWHSEELPSLMNGPILTNFRGCFAAAVKNILSI